MQQHHEPLFRGLYADQLERWLTAFDLSQVLSESSSVTKRGHRCKSHKVSPGDASPELIARAYNLEIRYRMQIGTTRMMCTVSSSDLRGRLLPK